MSVCGGGVIGLLSRDVRVMKAAEGVWNQLRGTAQQIIPLYRSSPTRDGLGRRCERWWRPAGAGLLIEDGGEAGVMRRMALPLSPSCFLSHKSGLMCWNRRRPVNAATSACLFWKIVKSPSPSSEQLCYFYFFWSIGQVQGICTCLVWQKYNKSDLKC